MTESVSELIAEYEAAKAGLHAIFSQNSTISDAAIRSLDTRVSKAFNRLIAAQLVNEKQVLERIHYFLKQIQTGIESDGLTGAFLATIERDVDVFAGTRSVLSGQDVDHELANANALVELCYTSKSRAPLTDDQLNALIQQAAGNNSKNGITAVLLYDENSDAFIQVLEGARENVRQLMTCLLFDDRHEQISICFEGKIEARMYEEHPLLAAKVSGLTNNIVRQLEQENWFKKLGKKSQILNQNYSYDWLMRTIGSTRSGEIL